MVKFISDPKDTLLFEKPNDRSLLKSIHPKDNESKGQNNQNQTR